MERARWKVDAASRNNSAGGAAGWKALRAPESRERCEMLCVCYICHPVGKVGEKFVAYPTIASKPKQPAINSAKAALAALEAAAVATSAANKAAATDDDRHING